MRAIDWSTSDPYQEDTCECGDCGTTFRSHAKAVMSHQGAFCLYSRKPCPKCGSSILRRVSSDPETMTLKSNSCIECDRRSR
jgi:hypothetical protein